MSNQRRTILIPVEKTVGETKPGRKPYIELQVYYDKGDFSWGTKTPRRGYYVSASPVELETGDGFTTKLYMLFRGVKHFLEDAKRFGEKRLETLFAAVEADHKAKQGMAWTLVQRVAEEEKLTITES